MQAISGLKPEWVEYASWDVAAFEIRLSSLFCLNSLLVVSTIHVLFAY